MLRPSALVLAFLTAAAAAQPAPADATGPYAALGRSAPERLLFPAGADPVAVVGVRLSPRLSVEAGYARETRSTAWPSGSSYVSETRERTGGLVVSGAYAGPVGPARARLGLTVGYDIYSYRETETRTGVGRDGLPFTETRVAFEGRSESLRLATSAEAAAPFRIGPVGVAPALGVAAAIASRTAGALGTQPAHAMPYVRVPVSARVGGVGLTLAPTAGVAFGPSVDPFSRSPNRSAGTPSGTPIAEVAVRASF